MFFTNIRLTCLLLATWGPPGVIVGKAQVDARWMPGWEQG
jgi:hypothetical protein